MVTPAARSEGRAHSSAGQVRQGKRHDASTADAATRAKMGPVTVATGTAE